MAQTYAFRIQAEGLNDFRAQLDAAAKSNEDMATAWERLKAASPQLTTALQAAQQTTDRVSQALVSHGQAVERTTASLSSHAQAADRASGGTRNFNQVMGQAGFQIQDFAVQVQGGTSALTAFSQQGSQLLGVFGTGGAVAGAVLTVAALVAQFVLGKDAASQMVEAIKAQAESYKQAEAAARQWRASLEEEGKRVLQLRDYYASLSDARRGYETRIAETQRGDLGKAQEVLRGQLTDTLRERINPAQLEQAKAAAANLPPDLRQAYLADPDLQRLEQANKVLDEFRRSARLTEDELATLSTRLRDIAGEATDPWSRGLRSAATELEKQGPKVREISEAIKALDERYRALTGALNENERAQEQGRAGSRDAAVAQINADMALVQARIEALRAGGLEALDRVTAGQKQQAEVLAELTRQLEAYEKALRQSGMAEGQIAEAMAKARPEFQQRIGDLVASRAALET